ncbi:MAG: D-Ala-D-Ala carboxypeptidase family metallohydrolase [Colwellia sp.]|nr:D-Ala-D-Ala carboxypeptidase family metallohydrolase [Colwellia sp.]
MDRHEKLSDHFTLGELIKSETAERKGINNTPPVNLVPKLRRLCTELLEPIRINYGKPLRPNSGYRSIELNKEIGGSSASQHCKAEAVDIEVPGVSNYDLAVWITNNLDFDQVILECYREGEPNSGWVHVSLKDEGEINRSMILTYSNRTYTNGLLA